MSRSPDRKSRQPCVWRERCGIVCVMGAVACFGTIVTLLSQPFEVGRSAWEEELFGDLRDDSDLSKSDEEQVALTEHSAAERPPEDSEQISEMTHGDELITVGVAPPQFLVTPLDERPIDRQPRFVIPARHDESNVSTSVWLSGGIEEETEHPLIQLGFAPDDNQD